MKNVLLVFGGVSYEHDISVVTASQIYNKTKIQDVNLILFYISRNGEFFIYESKKFYLNDFSKSKFSAKNKKFKQVVIIPGENNIIFAKSMFGLKEYLKVETAIFACHGGDGENGKLVSIFESVGIFSDAGGFDGLSICMNKFLFKQTMKGLNIPTVRGIRITEREFVESLNDVLKNVKKLKFPVIIKSNTGGSSIGVFTAYNESQFIENVKSAFEFDDEVVVERLIENSREFNVAVLGSQEDFQISEIDEPKKIHEILSFNDKYLSGSKGKGGTKKVETSGSMASQEHKFSAYIDENIKTQLKKYAEKIFKNLNLCGVVRIDFLFDKDTQKLYVCEVNAIPGSLAFYFFCKSNLLVNDLTAKLIHVAENNKLKKKFVNPEFTTSILDG